MWTIEIQPCRKSVRFYLEIRHTNETKDHPLWSKLSEGGKEVHCGWLTDKFGMSWQIVPANIADMLGGSDAERSGRVMSALLQMTKLDIAQLQKAFDNE